MKKTLKYVFPLHLILTSLACGEFYAYDNQGFDDDAIDELTYEQMNDFSNLLSDTYPSNEQSYTAEQEIVSKNNKICHYSLFGEMLYLKAYYQGMNSVIFDNQTDFGALTNPSTTNRKRNISLKNFDLNFDFGFRVGAGFKTRWLGLENQLIWMSFHSHTDHSFKLGVPFSEIYSTTWAASFSEPCGTGYRMSYKAKIHWEQIDLFSKLPIQALHRLTLSPKLGLRGVLSKIRNQIYQIKTEWGCSSGLLAVDPPQNTQTTKLKQDFNAIGLLTGLDTDINFGMGFHFDALFNAALVFGQMQAKNYTSTVTPVEPNSSLPTKFLSVYNFYLLRPIIDTQLLLSWKKQCFRNKVGFNLYAGYEVHYMPNFLHMDRLTDINSEVLQFDLSMQGFTAGMGLSF